MSNARSVYNMATLCSKNGGTMLIRNLATQLSDCVLQPRMPQVFTAGRIWNCTGINLQIQYIDRRVPE